MREPAKPAVSVVRAKEAGTPSNFFDAKRWRDHDRGIGQTIADVIHELLITDAAIGKLGARGISAHEAGQLPRNRHVTVRNPREAGRLTSTAAPGRENRRRSGVDARH
jgi:hypothetical protein